jgi:outer membrane receptor protein involved in Fe transport
MRGTGTSPRLRAAWSTNFLLTTATAAVLAAAAGIAGAQTTATSGAATASAAPASGSPLEEVVVTATRREESLSKIAVSVTAVTQEGLDVRGIKDIEGLARFTPGINVDNSGTNNIAIRGIASSGGAGTTGIYIDDTPIQMRALAFNPDEAVPKSFDVDRVEVLRGPQGTLFGAGSMGGTVRYITTQPSLTKDSVYGRSELSYTQDGDPSYEAGIAVGGPLIDNKLGARVSLWYRKDGGWIDRINPDTLAISDSRANFENTTMARLAFVWAANDNWTVTPAVYYEYQKKNDVSNFWTLYSNPSSNHYVSANPTQRFTPDELYLPSLKIEGNLSAFRLISNTSYYHRTDTTGYDGTMYNLGFYQQFFPFGALNPLLIDGQGIHLNDPLYNPPGIPGALGYRAPATVDNGQQNFTQEIRLQSADPHAKFLWTTGLFYANNKQTYLEQIHDPNLGQFLQAIYTGTGNSLGAGATPNDYILDFFGIGYDPMYPTDSYFLKTHAKDEQMAWFGEGSFQFTDQLKLTVGARYSRIKFSFNSITGGPQLYDVTTSLDSSKTESAFTPKVGLNFQADPNNLYYAVYAKGFRPGGGNNPVPYASCASDFQLFGIPNAPPTYNSDSVDSYELGAKNNFNNRVRLASSVYYIKWHNIQQTVVPPVCQISFISNLGEAEAKGLDVQADIAFTNSLTMDLTAGYTDARYTKDSRLSPDPTLPPIVASGDAIVGLGGQPGAPFTGSVGLEYRFSAFEKESFVRADYEYQGAPKWVGPSQDPNTGQYDQGNYSLPATSFLTLRGGVQLGDWAASLFIDNVTDAHPVTNYDWTIDPGSTNPAGAPPSYINRVQRNYTFRPRTIGLTLTFRR